MSLVVTVNRDSWIVCCGTSASVGLRRIQGIILTPCLPVSLSPYLPHHLPVSLSSVFSPEL